MQKNTCVALVAALSSQESKANKIGEVSLQCHTPEGPREISFKNVLVVPKLRKNLLSIKKICSTGAVVTFEGDMALIALHGKVVMTGKLVGNDLYQVILTSNKPASSYTVSIDQWHQRLGHISEPELRKLEKEEMVAGLSLPPNTHLSPCETCAHAKQKRTKFSKAPSNVRTTAIGQIIHTDLCPLLPKALEEVVTS